MKKTELDCDFETLIAVTRNGDAIVVGIIPEILEDLMDGDFCYDNGWKDFPVHPGIYSANVSHRVTCDGVSRHGESAEFDSEFVVTGYSKCKLTN